MGIAEDIRKTIDELRKQPYGDPTIVVSPVTYQVYKKLFEKDGCDQTFTEE